MLSSSFPRVVKMAGLNQPLTAEIWKTCVTENGRFFDIGVQKAGARIGILTLQKNFC